MNEKTLDYLDYSLNNWSRQDLINEVVRLYNKQPDERKKWENFYEESLKQHPFEGVLEFPMEYLDSEAMKQAIN